MENRLSVIMILKDYKVCSIHDCVGPVFHINRTVGKSTMAVACRTHINIYPVPNRFRHNVTHYDDKNIINCPDAFGTIVNGKRGMSPARREVIIWTNDG